MLKNDGWPKLDFGASVALPLRLNMEEPGVLKGLGLVTVAFGVSVAPPLRLKGDGPEGVPKGLGLVAAAVEFVMNGFGLLESGTPAKPTLVRPPLDGDGALAG